MTTSVTSGSPCWLIIMNFRASLAARNPRLRRLLAPRSSGPVELLVDVARNLAGDTGDRLEFLAAGRKEPLGRAEVLEQGALAGRADALQLIEDRSGHRLVAAASVVLDREPVGLVADPLQQLRRLRVRREVDRRPAAGYEHLLLALRERRDGHPALDERAQRA